MQQTAWLHAVPKDDKKGRLTGEDAKVSRLDQFKAEDRAIVMPENPAPYITEWLFEIGPVTGGAMGRGRIEWQDISAWSRMMATELLPWEARLIRRLSQDYLTMLAKAEKPDCPAPWISETEANRNVVASKVAAIFGGRSRKD